MADRLATPATGSIDSHPDFPEFFRQAREEVFGEFSPRIEQALTSGNTGAFERLTAEIDRRARQRAVVATRAMLNFASGQGGPMFGRPYSTPTLSGAENQPEAPPAPPPASTAPPPMQQITGDRPPPQTLAGAPVVTSAPSPLAFMDNSAETGLDPRALSTAYDRPGYRPTSGIALGPQSQQEGADLASDARGVNAFMEVSGLAPLRRAGQHAIAGRPLEAAGNLATAVIPYRPVAGLGALGATYGAAAAADILPSVSGMFSTPQAGAQEGAPDGSAGDRKALEGLIGQQATLRAQAEAARLRMEAERASGIGPRFNAAKLAYETANATAAAMDEQVRLLNARLPPEAISARAEYDRSVLGAEAALREARGRIPRPFRDTHIGSLYEATGGWTPAAVGAGTSAVARLVGRGARESVAEGVLAGALTPNAPLVWDMFSQPSYNPERAMYSALARDLPPGHPRRAEWTQYAASLPEANPVRRLASEEFYDPVKLGERVVLGAAEGVAGGLFGTGLAEGARRIGSSVRSGLGSMFGRRPSTQVPETPSTASGTPASAAGTGQPLTPAEIARRRQDAGFRLPENAPVAEGAVETWVSPSGRDLVTRGPDGLFRFEAGTHGSRGGQNAGDPRGRRGWRRISGVDMIMFGGIPPSAVG